MRAVPLHPLMGGAGTKGGHESHGRVTRSTQGQRPLAEMRAIAGTNRPVALARGMRWNPRNPVMARITIDASEFEAQDAERLIDAMNGAGLQLSQVCYHPLLGPIQTCDTCIVEAGGQLFRAAAQSRQGEWL
jgi:predicted molibdopterin-dependent oxidoreductase YjgC